MTTWRKSSHSDETGGQCVEVAALPRAIAIRDSKSPAAGRLELPRHSFAALLAHLRRERPSD
ncbi:hypothetical protein GCM10009527_037310 [Actinomadura nitritigenes]|uniref:DUF397 domain-containing protein n=1 Tax=Actinomadura nitritigenes TaxID=134602 RepID=A0ABS3QRC0_9ACTN|nr:DUF397 domain-containing protein [Actinomadura nitritigenes]MBO2436530.1 DUF397 domain-containing protein [Actinomadura nitritigenes]